MRSVKIGAQLPMWDYHVHSEVSFSHIREVALCAEELGFDYVSADDHLSRGRGGRVYDSWTTLSALASLTKRVRLVTIVLCNLYRYPSVLGKMAATLDDVSGGRVEIGIGAGWKQEEADAFGIPWAEPRERLDRLEESVELLKRLWTEEKAYYEGRYYKLNGAVCNPKPKQKPHPPIWIGGGGEKRTLRIVARLANVANFAAPGIGSNKEGESEFDYFKRKRDLVKQYCEEIGRPFNEIQLSASINLMLWGKEEDYVKRSIDEAVSRGLSQGEIERMKHMFDTAVRTPEECLEKIKAYIDCGATYFTLNRCTPYGLRLFAKEVMPKL
ncbi:MAG TPA: LLM class flavin-dependent oxidoreductase [Clostridia bacterium]|nr:LLM class flavin-dependent oxidoreductase [Clostridia bacterium]